LVGGCELPTNFTQKDLAELKILQKVWGGASLKCTTLQALV